MSSKDVFDDNNDDVASAGAGMGAGALLMSRSTKTSMKRARMFS